MQLAFTGSGITTSLRLPTPEPIAERRLYRLATTPSAPTLEDAVNKVLGAVRTEKSARILIKNLDQAEKLRQRGFTKIAVGTDVAFLRVSFDSIAKAAS